MKNSFFRVSMATISLILNLKNGTNPGFVPQAVRIKMGPDIKVIPKIFEILHKAMH